MTVLAELPDAQRLRILQLAAGGSRLASIARAANVDAGIVQGVIAEAVSADKMVLRVAVSSLKGKMQRAAAHPTVPAPRDPDQGTRPKRPRKPRPVAEPVGPIEPPHPAVPVAAELHDAVHAQDQAEIAAVLATLDRPALAEVAVALAAMLPARLDPARALAWIDEPADQAG